MDDVQIIKTPSGEELVVIPRADYEALIAARIEYDEDADDIAIYDARLEELAVTDMRLPIEVSRLMLRGDSRLRAIRRWKGMTQTNLALQAKLTQGYLSDIESGRRTGSSEVLARVAKILAVPPTWLS